MKKPVWRPNSVKNAGKHLKIHWRDIQRYALVQSLKTNLRSFTKSFCRNLTLKYNYQHITGRNTAVHIVADFPLDEIILMNAKINVKTKIGSLKINGIQYWTVLWWFLIMHKPWITFRWSVKEIRVLLDILRFRKRWVIVYLVCIVIRDPFQISILILSKFRWINKLLSPLE